MSRHSMLYCIIYTHTYIYRTDKEGTLACTLETAIETDTLTALGGDGGHLAVRSYSALPENGPVHEERRPRWTATLLSAPPRSL